MERLGWLGKQGEARSGEASGGLSSGLQAAREREGSEPGRRGGEERGRRLGSYPLAQSISGGEDLLRESTMAGAPQCCFTVLRKTKEILQFAP
jgi:hypothetical protein